MKERLNAGAWMLAALFAWCWAWRHLSIEWRTNEQYQYGFGVPFLFLWMVWKRRSGPLVPEKCRAGCAAALVASWLMLALGELLRWHDPIWRLTGALLAASATLLTAACFFRLGGRPLLRREIFPLVFAWMAVPWPVPVEMFITQHLLHFLTGLTVSVLDFIGIAAFQHGNVIELTNGVIGLDDACSGIRSLQSTLMATLFLGEFLSLANPRRVVLLFGGWVFSVVFNCARVLTLALVLHTHNEATVLRFHDPVGDIATLLTFLAILGLALALGHRGKHSQVITQTALQPLPGREGTVVLAAFAAIPLLVLAWFASLGVSATALPVRPQWALDSTHLPQDWRAEPMNPRPGEAAALRFSEWHGWHVRSTLGWDGRIIRLAWKPGTSMPSLAFYHTPALCMPWVGWTEVGRSKKMDLQVHGQTIPCVSYRFTQDGAGQIVLQSLSSGGQNGYHVLDPNHLEDRYQRFLTLWKAPLKQVNEELLIYLPDLGDDKAQVRAFTDLLDALLVEPVR